MAGYIRHAYTATGTDAGNGEVHKAQWNAAHSLVGVPYCFAQSAVAVSVGAVTTEATLATISFAGGEIGPNGWVQVISSITVTNGANNKTQRIRLGGIAGTAICDSGLTTSNGNSRITAFANRNSASSQVSFAPSGNNVGVPGQYTAAFVTTAVNTASAWDLVITGQKASAGDTFTLEGYQVLVCYGA